MKRIFALILLTSLVAFPCAAAARSAKKEVKNGNSLYNKGKFEEALKRYEEALLNSPDSDIVNFNLGAALYKTKDYKAAANHFERSLVSDDKKLEQNANYNLGNTEYRYGISKEDSDIDEAIGSLTSALGHYERAILIDPEDEDAKYNYEFVKKELKRLKKKKKEFPPPPQKQQQDKKDQQQSQRQQKQKEKQKEQKQEEQKKQKGQKQEQKEKQKEQEQEEQKMQYGQRPKAEDRKRQPEGKVGGQKPRPQGEMTQEEASSLLENYRNEEEPKGMYKEKRPAQWYMGGYKDW